MTLPKVKVTEKASIGKKVFKSLGAVEQTIKNVKLFAALIIISAFLFFINLGLSGLAANPHLSHGLFHNSIGNMSALYPLNITPAGWTFSIWGIIFLFQIAMYLYSLALLCRETGNGPAYLHPPVLSPIFFMFLSLTSIFVSVWLFLWDNIMFASSFVFLACVAASLLMALSIVSARLAFFQSELVDRGSSLDVKVIRIAAVNGLGIYGTWTVIATLLNLGVVLVYKLGRPLSNEAASITCTSVLAFFFLCFALLDLICLDRYTRFTITPYLTIIWALVGVITRNWDANNVSSIISAVLLGVSGFALIVKVALSYIRQQAEHNPYRRMKVASPQN